MKLSTRSHPDAFPSILNAKDELRASQNPLFEIVRNEAHDAIPISAWKVALNEKLALTPAGMVTVVHDEAPVEF